MKYQVISCLSVLQLERKVNQLLSDGWELQGGISVTADRDGNEAFAQAMTKKERDSGVQHMIDDI